nr:MAG: hypothetical protein [Inoviridae sp.]
MNQPRAAFFRRAKMPIPTGTRPAARQNSKMGCLVISVTMVPDRVNTSAIAAITVSIALFATSAPASAPAASITVFMVASPFLKIFVCNRLLFGGKRYNV